MIYQAVSVVTPTAQFDDLPYGYYSMFWQDLSQRISAGLIGHPAPKEEERDFGPGVARLARNPSKKKAFGLHSRPNAYPAFPKSGTIYTTSLLSRRANAICESLAEAIPLWLYDVGCSD